VHYRAALIAHVRTRETVKPFYAAPHPEMENSGRALGNPSSRKRQSVSGEDRFGIVRYSDNCWLRKMWRARMIANGNKSEMLRDAISADTYARLTL